MSNPFIPLLTVLFIGLKLTNYIDWSWWWVLSPIWIPVIVVLIIAIVVAIAKPPKTMFVGHATE